MKHGGYSERKAQLMGGDWNYDHEHRVQLLRNKALSWLASDRERQQQQGSKHEAMNSYEISPGHAFVAKAYGHCVDSMVAPSTTPTTTEQPTARNSASKHKAQPGQSLLVSLKRNRGIGCPDFGYSQTHRVLRGMESNRWWRGLETFRQWRR
jgi:hypothetical protein